MFETSRQDKTGIDIDISRFCTYNIECIEYEYQCGRDSLVKSSSINADHNPRIGKQHVRLLEGLDVFKSV